MQEFIKPKYTKVLEEYRQKLEMIKAQGDSSELPPLLVATPILPNYYRNMPTSGNSGTSREIAVALEKQVSLLLQNIEKRGTPITPSEMDSINKLRADIQFFNK